MLLFRHAGKWSRSVMLGILMAFSGGCSTARTAVPAAAAGEALLASLQVTPAGDSVTLVMQVTNTLESPVRLDFSSGQMAEFSVSRSGSEIWRWSNDQMFTQALQSETLGVGETLRTQASWTVPAGLTGQLQATARLLAEGAEVEQTTTFALP